MISDTLGHFFVWHEVLSQRGENKNGNDSLATFAVGDSNHATRNNGASEGSAKEIDILRVGEYVFGGHC